MHPLATHPELRESFQPPPDKKKFKKKLIRVLGLPLWLSW